MASIDSTYTSRKKKSRTTISAKGSAQPQGVTTVSQYTNCIVTCPVIKGKQWNLPVLYSLNPIFRNTLPSTRVTAKNRANLTRLKGLVRAYNLDWKQIQFFPQVKGKNKKYLPESAVVIRDFFRVWPAPKNTVILHDGGTAYKEKKVSIFPSLGVPEHYPYPKETHASLSVNDHDMHGAAKQQFFAQRQGPKDDMADSLLLLKILTDTPRTDIQGWADRNLCRKDKELTEKVLLGVLKNPAERLTRKHKAFLAEYRIYARKDTRLLWSRASFL